MMLNYGKRAIFPNLLFYNEDQEKVVLKFNGEELVMTRFYKSQDHHDVF